MGGVCICAQSASVCSDLSIVVVVTDGISLRGFGSVPNCRR